ncbi:MAG: hypothetical protein STHCBS139747_001926 [Sporothrix thermara]
MFDMNINRLMAGTDIGRPTNALTLTVNCHDEFGAFRIYFEATNRPHTYLLGRIGHDILRDAEDAAVADVDGTTKSGALVSLRLNGWFKGIAA